MVILSGDLVTPYPERTTSGDRSLLILLSTELLLCSFIFENEAVLHRASDKFKLCGKIFSWAAKLQVGISLSLWLEWGNVILPCKKLIPLQS